MGAIEATIRAGRGLLRANWQPNGPRPEEQAAIDVYRQALALRASNWQPNGPQPEEQRIIDAFGRSERTPFGGGG